MRQIPIDAISDVLALDPKPRSYEELDQLATSGLKKSALISCVSTLCQDECDYNRILYQLVPKTEFLSERDCLTPIEAAWTEVGTRRMERVLWEIFYGCPV